MLILGLIAGTYIIVLNGLFNIEEHEAIDNSERAENYIYYKISDVDRINKDWAFWDSSYYFMDDKNTEFIGENFVDSTYYNLKINSILYFDLNSTLFYGEYYNLDDDEFTNIPKGLLDSIKEHISVKGPDPSEGIAGFMEADGNLHIVSINPVLTSNMDGTPKGILVMTKEVSGEYLSEISDEINIELELTGITGLNREYPEINGMNSRLISYGPDEEEIYVKSMISDISDRPVAVLTVTDSRDLFALGLSTVTFFSGYVLILCAAVVIILNITFESLFTRRLESVSYELKRIASTKDYESRLKDEHDDEISLISDSGNILLETIQRNVQHLEEKNRELNRTLLKKSELIAELHHRVKNNLQYIISLLGIKSLKIKDPEALEVINDATGRIKYLGMIHDDLYRKEERKTLLFKSHLFDLANLIMEGMSEEKREKISVQITGDEFETDLSYAIPLSTALYELIKNSTEHAFDQKGGRIDIDIKKSNSGIIIKVKDDGTGIGNPEGKEFSFGINFAKNIITKQLSGTMENIRSETGTCWLISLKKIGTDEEHSHNPKQ
ncbi:CHASE4 domain-containing protein [Methanoplanus limicola]|uniref:histidine kinase n=1 Tax=Methanoplanus limicola DSM 2279 TaxID=937775 RepID=H1YYG2_9EURY|nr:CHASE4 domain-containing protein [Methanoplanus limicola]EHQ35060.1 histidine kinase [Methanoplanus limicola DSM 2279]